MFCLPDDIGMTHFLCRELNASNNQLSALPAEISGCARLRILRVNNNRIENLPSTISGCRLLEEIYAADNQMHDIPSEVGDLSSLRVLKLQRNRLQQLPCELGDCLSIEDIDCTSNPELVMVPATLRSDTKLIMWICRQAKGVYIACCCFSGPLLSTGPQNTVRKLWTLESPTKSLSIWRVAPTKRK